MPRYRKSILDLLINKHFLHATYLKMQPTPKMGGLRQ
jgi:hypothetical protein